MAKRKIGKFVVSDKESLLSVKDGGTVDGALTVNADAQITVTNPVSGSATAITVSKATHAGRTTMLPQNVGAGVIHVMPAPEVGIHYHFVRVGTAVANEDISFASDAASTFYEGAISFHDDGGSAQATVYCDGTTADLIDLIIPGAVDLHFVGKSSTVYYVYGSVTGATTFTCA